jgi:uncharacterized LabA/DUF88 family protein
MSFKNTVRVVQPGGRRLKVFVDFWNVVISARQQVSKFEIEVRWDALTELILDSTHRGFSDETIGELAGCYIFGSYTKSDPDDQAFVNNTLDSYGSNKGLFFDFRERVKKQTRDKCHQCKSPISRHSESGVDVLLTVEMIKHASMREHDYLALLSSDRDYIPLLSFLKDQGHRVLHIAAGEPHREMRSVTWAQVQLKEFYPNICSVEPTKCLIITAPPFSEKIGKVKAVLEQQRVQYDIVDISNKTHVPNKDLEFLMKNQRMHFSRIQSDGVLSYSWNKLCNDLDGFRDELSNGRMVCNLPYVIRNGTMDFYCDGMSRWVSNGANSEKKTPCHLLSAEENS